MQKVSNNNVANIFATLNRLKQPNKKNNSNNNNNYNQNETKARAGQWHREELIFGEELNTYIPFETNIQRTIMERDPYAGVKMLVSHVTMYLYGEPKFVDHVVGVYKELKNAREDAGFVGMRGKSMKGLIAAILYLVILFEERARLTLNELIKAVNHVRSESKVVVTEKMIQQYIVFIKKHVKVFQQRSNENNNRNNNSPLMENIKRLSILLEYPIKVRVAIQKTVSALPKSILENHMPNTIAMGLTFLYAEKHGYSESYPNQKAMLERTNVTRYSMKKITDKLRKYF
jgi:glycerol-3-phosphate cytidylyltransferase-like family protein